MFPATFISGSCDFTLPFNFGVLRTRLLIEILTNFADAYISVMAWMGYVRAQLQTLSSLLKPETNFLVLNSNPLSPSVNRHSQENICKQNILPVVWPCPLLHHLCFNTKEYIN